MDWLTALMLVGGAYGLFSLFKFVKADCDLRLLSLTRLPPGAFDCKVVWITGASQGLGEYLAKFLASNKANLIISARDVGRLEVSCNTSRFADVPLPTIAPIGGWRVAVWHNEFFNAAYFWKQCNVSFASLLACERAALRWQMLTKQPPSLVS